MSPVTGLVRLGGLILLSVHMENFSSVHRDEIQETQPAVRGCGSFVVSCNFTNKTNSHTPKVEIHKRQK